MNRTTWITLTTIGCLLGAYGGHRLGRRSAEVSATVENPPAEMAPREDTITRDDPESAYAWASRITAPELRAETLENVVQRWRRLDPAAAAAAQN